MKSSRFLKLAVLASVCVFALVVAVGCKVTVQTGSGSGSASASSTAASSESQSSAASTDVSKGSSSASTTSTSLLTDETAAAQGYQVFTGTVRVCGAAELIKLQGKDIDPAVVGSGNGTYAVLVFDQPTAVTGQSADGSGLRTETAHMLGIAEYTAYSSFTVEYGDLTLCESLNGQQVKIAAKADNITFPSDVRLPIGEPQANTIVVM